MPLLLGRDHGGDCLSTKEVTQSDIRKYESGGSNSLKDVPLIIPVCAIGAPALSENDIYRKKTGFITIKIYVKERRKRECLQ